MRTEPSSLDIYNKIPREFSFSRTKPTVKHVEDLLETMKAELIISSYSPLLDASFNECSYYCSNHRIATIKFDANNYYITEMRRRSVLPTFDAWQFPILLSDYLNGSLSANTIENLLPYFWGNYVPKDPDPRRVLQAFKAIDTLIVELRRKMYTGMPVNSMDSKSVIPKDFVITELVKQEIADKVKAIAKQIEKDYEGEELLVVGILKGASVFVSDLIRNINLDVNIDFMSVSSYGNGTESSGTVRILKDLDVDIANKNVLIVEDIIDSGLTLSNLVKELGIRNPKSLKLCTLLDKPERRTVNIPVDYVGFVIEDKFIVGYGIDWAEKYRNLPYIGSVNL